MVLAAAVALTACGSAGGSSRSVTKTTVPVNRKVVLTSIMTTAAAKTARIDLEVGMSRLSSAKVTGDGVVGFGSGDSQMTMHVDGPLGSVMSDGF